MNMWLDVTLLVTLLGNDASRRNQFDAAMLRRGWSKDPRADDAYRAGLPHVESDDDVVQVCERDVKQSAYVAGVSRFQATCLIAGDESTPATETNGFDAASRFDLADDEL
jgi:hypothetical protein